MNTQTLKTPWSRTSAVARGLSIAAIAAGAWALSAMGSQAHARSDVHWSIGVNVPGVVVGASSAPPVYYAPAPVYYGPPPVYYAPRPIYYSPPPVYYAPRPVYRSGWGPAPRWEGHRHGHRHGWDRHDRRR
ncbi:hypothetical protein [Hydrogenophaga laconesensis]|uniref:PXPV repeat-containing protein n=1 Tax=Hydrogenophaga laconesensis TaxID=1805971 RepID=A0ABU1VB26_9BURK|nr:hypothetical protein [Hydrogenophaga laconesensis]MDR7094647.1 hypothetical protein [Hydrogenophaga laconesensis]